MTAHIPLVESVDVLDSISPLVQFLSTLSNSTRAYAYRPEIPKVFITLEMAVLSAGTGDTLPKTRIGYLASRVKRCDYCASDAGGRLSRNGVSDSEMVCMLRRASDTGDAALGNAIRFARQAVDRQETAFPVAKMSSNFSTPQIAEIACVVGFLSWTNCVREPLGFPPERHFEDVGVHCITMDGSTT